MKKISLRILSSVLLIVMMVSLTSVFTFAETVTVTETETVKPDILWEYEEYGDGIELTKYLGNAIDVYAPSKITDDGVEYTVVKLGDSLFENNDSINSVTLGDGITEIGARTFYDADNLVCIVTNEQITTIGDSAFYSCDVFNSIILYDSVTSIGVDAFSLCPLVTIWCNENSTAHIYALENGHLWKLLGSESNFEVYTENGITYNLLNATAVAVGFDNSVTEITVPSTVKGLPVVELRDTFNGSMVKKVVLSEGIKIISGAFQSSQNLEEVILPESLTTIGAYSFAICPKLQTLIIPENVNYLGKGVFQGSGVKHIDLTYGITEIPESAFLSSKIVSVSIPQTVTLIGKSAFSRSSIKSVHIPSSVKIIESFAFYECYSLSDLTLEEGVEKIDVQAFYRSNQLVDNLIFIPKSVTFMSLPFSRETCLAGYQGSYAQSYAKESGNPFVIYDGKNEVKLVKEGGISYALNGKEAKAYYFDDSVSKVTVPATIDGLPVVLYKTFYDSTSITSVTLSDGIKEIGYATFKSCDNLTEVVLPNTVTTIDSQAFQHSKKLTGISLPDGIENIGDEAFSNSGIKEIIIPSSVKTLENSTFSDCLNLEKVILPNGLSTIGESAFANCTSLLQIDLSYVKSIAKSAFSNCTSLKSVTFSNNLTYIGESAFSYCTSLESALLPESITDIGTKAFEYCSALKTVTIPGSVINIGGYTFQYCTGLTEAVFESGISYVPEDAFRSCTSLKKVVLSYTITELKKCAFISCSSLTDIVIPDSVTSICDNAFTWCTTLKKINIPKNVSSMGMYAFSDCDSLEELIIAEGVTIIGNRSFGGCESLKNITIPSSVTTLSEGAFEHCFGLETVVFNDGLKTIGPLLFNQCSKIKELTIPASVTSIASNSFSKNTVLYVYENSYAHSFVQTNEFTFSIIDDEDKPKYETLYGITYVITDGVATPIEIDAEAESVTILATVNGYPVDRKDIFKNSAVKNIVIGEGITSINDSEFYGCKSLVSITFPESLRVIGNYSFFACVALKEVIIPSGVTTIGTNAFDGCSKMTKVIIPNTVTTIGQYAFSACTSLTNVNIPTSISTIVPYMFHKCSSLSLITIPSNIITIDKYAFAYCTSLVDIELPDSITNIKDNAFYTCSSLKNVKLPKHITMLNYKVFASCSSLENIELPYGLEKIDTSFSDCTALKKIVIPDSVTNLRQAFWGCSSLVEVDLPPYVTSTKGTFNKCSSLESIELPEGVQIGDFMFKECNSLKSITIPDGCQGIGEEAFSQCLNLETVIMPDTVVDIEISAFENCRKLKSINFSKNIRYISRQAFENCVSLKEAIIPSVSGISSEAFRDCSSLQKVHLNFNGGYIYNSFIGCSSITSLIISGELKSVYDNAFSNSYMVKTVYLPKTVTNMTTSSFSYNTVMLVHKDSYAHTFAKNNGFMYFVLGETSNPEIAFGDSITGTITYTDGSVVSGATVEIYHDDGTLKETVTADANGNYKFTYAEVGGYTIKAYDSLGNVASTNVNVTRINAFDVYVSGDTSLTLKKGYTVSGSVSEDSTVTITDLNANVIASVQSENGTFSIGNIPNGTYVVKAESENGFVTTEITVFGADVNGIELILPQKAETVTITGTVQVKDREGNLSPKAWADVMLYDSSANAVSKLKTENDGTFKFEGLATGEYSIMVQAKEMRPDREDKHDRSHVLTGSAYVNADTVGEYTADIVIKEREDGKSSIEGKVTANGETQDCEVILHDIFRNEIARYTTKKNGKYKFDMVDDGLYFIVAVTKSNGMGYTIIAVKDGKVHGDSDIRVYKSDKVASKESKFFIEVPDCFNKEDALIYRERIAQEKTAYDALSDKEREQLSKEYVDRLNKYCEWISDCEYITDDGVTVQNGGLIVSGDELENETEISFTIKVEKIEAPETSDDGVKDKKDHKNKKIKDAAGDNEIKQYYDISMFKTANGEQKPITSVYKDTDASGKFRITMEIPEEYRGYKHYSFVHEHCGEVTTLTDLDDDPNTVTFEIDKFSTFVLTATNDDLTPEIKDEISVIPDERLPQVVMNEAGNGVSLDMLGSWATRVYWGYIGEEEIPYTWFDDFRLGCGTEYNADFTPRADKAYYFTKKGYYRFVLKCIISGDAPENYEYKDMVYTFYYDGKSQVAVPSITVIDGNTVQIEKNGLAVTKLYYGNIGPENVPYGWFNDFWGKALATKSYKVDFGVTYGEHYKITTKGFYNFVIVYNDAEGVSHEVVYTVEAKDNIGIITAENGVATLNVDNVGGKVNKLYYGYIGSDAEGVVDFDSLKAKADTLTGDWTMKTGKTYTLTQKGYYGFCVNYTTESFIKGAFTDVNYDIIYIVENK